MAKKKVHYAWITLAGTCVMMAVGFGMVLDAPGIFWPSVTEYLGTGTGPLSSTMTVQGLCMALGMIIAGRLIPKYNYNVMLTIAAVTISGCFIAMSTFTELWQFYITAPLMGFAVAFTAPLPISIIISNWFEKKNGFASGIAYAFSGIMAAILMPVGDWLINFAGWRMGYVLYGAIAGVLLIPTALFIVRKTPEEKGLKPYGAEEKMKEIQSGLVVPNYGVPFKKVSKMVSFYLILLVALGLTWGGGIHQHFPVHALYIGLTSTDGAMFSTVVMAMQLVFNVPLGMIIDKYGVGRATMIYCLCSATGSLLLAFSTNIYLLYAGCALYGMGVCQTMVATSTLSRAVFGRKDYSKINSFVMMAFAISGSFTHMANGFLSDIYHSYTLPLCITACASLLAMIICNVVLFKEKKLVAFNTKMGGLLVKPEDADKYDWDPEAEKEPKPTRRGRGGRIPDAS